MVTFLFLDLRRCRLTRCPGIDQFIFSNSSDLDDKWCPYDTYIKPFE